MTIITIVWSDCSWESYTTDNSQSKHSSSGGQAREVHLDNTNGSSSTMATISHNKTKMTHLLVLYTY